MDYKELCNTLYPIDSESVNFPQTHGSVEIRYWFSAKSSAGSDAIVLYRNLCSKFDWIDALRLRSEAMDKFSADHPFSERHKLHQDYLSSVKETP